MKWLNFSLVRFRASLNGVRCHPVTGVCVKTEFLALCSPIVVLTLPVPVVLVAAYLAPDLARNGLIGAVSE